MSMVKSPAMLDLIIHVFTPNILALILDSFLLVLLTISDVQI